MSGVTLDIEESGDGTRRIIVWGHDHGDDLDSAQARQLAAALLAAADTLDDEDQDQPIRAIYAHTSGPQRAQLHAQLDADVNREALLAGMWPHLQAESQRLADDRDTHGRAGQ
ncbi:hypothetical protein LAUMK13_01930 [Mycobacterium innocens]|uniref:Uncharacterized protein n=1 Tax=Mycobacterium innocens TaxID=2341083 RepID=A0A498PZ29_9MYCO|nr:MULTISPECIES: hypothetical protein [Mycobacterium]VBA38039.1 hypothetical protein LAUMK13_01930 [Mycobacterium innocens]